MVEAIRAMRSSVPSTFELAMAATLILRLSGTVAPPVDRPQICGWLLVLFLLRAATAASVLGEQKSGLRKFAQCNDETVLASKILRGESGERVYMRGFWRGMKWKREWPIYIQKLEYGRLYSIVRVQQIIAKFDLILYFQFFLFGSVRTKSKPNYIL